MGHANEHGIKPIRELSEEWRREGEQKKNNHQKKKGGGGGTMKPGVHTQRMCALGSWNTVACRKAPYSLPVKNCWCTFGGSIIWELAPGWLKDFTWCCRAKALRQGLWSQSWFSQVIAEKSTTKVTDKVQTFKNLLHQNPKWHIPFV